MSWPLPLVALLVSAPPPPDAPDAHRTEIHGSRYDPVPTSVLSRERLAETAGGDVAAALDAEPGLTVSRLGGLGAFSTLSIRGSTPEQVLVVLDGIPLNPADGAPVDLSTLPVGPLDAIAVYRGRTPWSLGATGLGGALVLRTRAPDAPFGAEGELGAGAFETVFARAFAGLERPLGEGDRLGFSLAVDGLHSASDFRFENDGGTAWTRDDDHLDTRENAFSDQLSTLARASLELGTTHLALVDLYTRSHRGLPSLGVTPTTRSRFDLERHLVALHLDATPGPLVLGATLWLADTSTTVRDPLGEIGLGADSPSTLDSLVPGAVATLRLPLAPTRALRLVPSLHVSWRLESTRGSRAAPADRHLAAAAAELALKHKSGIEVAAGLRAESDLDQATAVATYLEAAYALPRLRLTLGARLSPRLPSLFELHGDTGLALGNPDLRPESAATLELGARWEPPLAFPVALALFGYATSASDLIQFIQNAQGVSRPENLAAARILGAELSLEATLFERLLLRSTLSLMDATDTSDIAARHGKQLPLRPSLATSHRLELRVADAALGDVHGAVGLYLELDHVAGDHLDFANLVAVPPRTLLGLGAYVRSDAAEVLLSLANVLGDRVQDLSGYPLPGLTTMLSLRLRSP